MTPRGSWLPAVHGFRRDMCFGVRSNTLHIFKTYKVFLAREITCAMVLGNALEWADPAHFGLSEMYVGLYCGTFWIDKYWKV